jgi:hypothetical protein
VDKLIAVRVLATIAEAIALRLGLQIPKVVVSIIILIELSILP